MGVMVDERGLAIMAPKCAFGGLWRYRCINVFRGGVVEVFPAVPMDDGTPTTVEDGMVDDDQGTDQDD